MSHADTERSNRITPPMSVPVIFSQRMTMQMYMLFTVMVMCMEVPAFPDQPHSEHATQKHKHDTDTKLRRQGEGFGNLHLERQYHRSDQQQHDCMSESPAQSNQAGSAKRGPLCQHRRDGGQVVRIQRVTEPQHQPKS